MGRLHQAMWLGSSRGASRQVHCPRLRRARAAGAPDIQKHTHRHAETGQIVCAAARAGEMVFPWMFDDFAALRPLRGVAEALAARAEWSPLYDVRALEATVAPVASATYFDDMYVDFECGQVRVLPPEVSPMPGRGWEYPPVHAASVSVPQGLPLLRGGTRLPWMARHAVHGMRCWRRMAQGSCPAMREAVAL